MAKKLSSDYIKWTLALDSEPARKAYQDLQRETRKLQQETHDCIEKMKGLNKGSKEWKDLNNQVKKNNKEIAENRNKMNALEKQFDKSKMSVSELRKHLNSLKREFNNTSKETHPERYKALQKQIKETQDALYKATGQTHKLSEALSSIAKLKTVLTGFFTAIGMVITQQVLGALKDMFTLIVDFEKENAKLAAILGTTKDGIKDLEEGARHLGATTSYSAAQVTQLQIELAKLGFSKQQILDMEGAVLKFAKSVDTDLGSAAAFAGATLRIFNKDASEAEDVLATCAVATTKTALDFSKLQTSMATVGPVANSFGFSLEDTTTLLGILANKGFDASTAATSLRNIMLKLCDSDSALAKSLGEPVKNAEDLANGLKKLKDEGVDLQKALELTDKRSVAAFTAVMDSAGDIGALRDSISGVSDEFNQMAETMGDTVSGAMAGLRSAAEELALKMSLWATGPLKSLIQGFTSFVTAIGNGIKWLGKYSGVIKVVSSLLVAYKGLLLTINAVKTSGIAIKGAYQTATLHLSMAYKRMLVTMRQVITHQRTLNSVMAGVSWMKVAAAIGAVVAAIVMWVREANKASDATRELTKIKDEANKKMVDEKNKIDLLVAAAKNENLTLSEREKAVKSLNKLIPNYNAQIDKTTGKYRASTTALKQYCDQLARKYELEGAKDKLAEIGRQRAELVTEQAAINEQRKQNELLRQTTTPSPFANISTTGTFPGPGGSAATNFGLASQEQALDVQQNKLNNKMKSLEDQQKAIMNAYGADLQKDAVNNAEEVEEAVTKTASSAERASGAASKTVDRLKEIKAELKELRKRDPATNEEYEQIQKRIKALQEEKKLLEGKNNKKGKHHESGTYGEDSIDGATAAIDDAHQKRLLEINKQAGGITDTELAIKKNQELILYCAQLNDALEKMKSETKSTHKQTLDKIAEEQNKVEAQALKAQQDLRTLHTKKMKEDFEESKRATETYYEEISLTVKQAVNDRKVSQEAADIYLEDMEARHHKDILADLQDYYDKVKKSDSVSAVERKAIMEDLEKQMRQAQNQVLTDAGNWAVKLREMSVNTNTPEARRAWYEMQITATREQYREMIIIAKQQGEDVTALEQECRRRTLALNIQYQQELLEIQQQISSSWQNEYDRELLALKNMHNEGIMNERQYQAKRLELGMENARKYYEYYSGLTSSMFSAIQDAEISMSEAKYDVLIQQAKNAGNDTTEIEQEKENAKLDIQKKYADVNFAIKVSEIVANTAVAIMQAFAQLGPVGGAVAAAMLSATGIAQTMVANAEREKIKKLQPGVATGASGSEGTPKSLAERTLTGFADGGYTGPGGRFQVAGLVHAGEYVVPQPIMSDRRVVNAVGVIEAIRRSRGLANGSANGTPYGYADGGHVQATAIDTSGLEAATRELRAAVREIRATVVLSDLDRARNTLDKAQAPFTR